MRSTTFHSEIVKDRRTAYYLPMQSRPSISCSYRLVPGHLFTPWEANSVTNSPHLDLIHARFAYGHPASDVLRELASN